MDAGFRPEFSAPKHLIIYASNLWLQIQEISCLDLYAYWALQYMADPGSRFCRLCLWFHAFTFLFSDDMAVWLETAHGMSSCEHVQIFKI
jgi:hypothetical protein